eukprot:g11223.t1
MAGRGSRQMDDEGIYAQLLEQASDLNDELCRENCELRREVSDLRQRQLQRMKRDAEGSRSAKVRKIMPQAMSNIRSALRDLDLEDAPSIEGLPSLLEEAANRVFASMAELQESNAAMASGEETAALIAEKVALKETGQIEIEALRLDWELLGVLYPPATTSLGAGACEGKADGDILQLGFAFDVGDECEVVGKKGAILRETEDLQSALVATVPPYGHVRIVQVAATQARRALVEVIDSPEVEPAPAGGCAVPGAMGWLSVSTKDGKPLLRPENKSEALPAPEVSEEAPRTDVEMEKPPEVEKIENEGEPGEPSQELESEQVEENVGEVLNTEMDLQLVPSAQRERQIKAMQAQVDSARMQLEQLDEVKAKLREYRSAALEARQRGQEFLEGLHMATEDRPVPTEEEPGAEVIPETEEPIALPEDSGVDEETVEWRRLLSERETTARELASTLRQVEEMEKEVEDKRIELDIAQRRGHPSGQKGRDEVGCPWSHVFARMIRHFKCGQDKERQYLQRISELEESVLKLQEQIDTVQARIALLNQQALLFTYRAGRDGYLGIAVMVGERTGLFEMPECVGDSKVPRPSVPQADVDLSRFAVPEGADSDDESLVPHPGSIPPFIPAAVALGPLSHSSKEFLVKH